MGTRDKCTSCRYHRICDGIRSPEDVLAEQLRKYKEVFLETIKQVCIKMELKICGAIQ
jgi:hypothetical protein